MKTLNRAATYTVIILAILNLSPLLNISWWLVFSPVLVLIGWGFVQGLFKTERKD
jgi:hypothetical protein